MLKLSLLRLWRECCLVLKMQFLVLRCLEGGRLHHCYV